MTTEIDHIKQANHNLICAKELSSKPEMYDWAYVICYYSAIHFAEAGLKHKTGKTTQELSGERNNTNTIGLHALRNNKILELFGSEWYRHFREMELNRYNLRYLRNNPPSEKIPSNKMVSIDTLNQKINETIPDFQKVLAQSGVKITIDK